MENNKARLRIHLSGTCVDLVLPKEKVEELCKEYQNLHEKWTHGGKELCGAWIMCPTFLANLGKISGLEVLPEWG